MDTHRTFHPSRLIELLWIAAIAVVTSACSYPAPVKASIDLPAGVTRLPLVVGIWYNPEFRAYEYVLPMNRIIGRPTSFFRVGRASVALLDRVFPIIFERVLPTVGLPPLPVDSPKVAAVIEPRIEDMRMMWPATDFGNNIADITYRFTLYAANGDPVASWTVNGVGAKAKPVGAVFSPDQARWPGEALDLAMENAVTKLLSVFSGIPEVQQWLRGIGPEEPR